MILVESAGQAKSVKDAKRRAKIVRKLDRATTVAEGHASDWKKVKAPKSGRLKSVYRGVSAWYMPYEYEGARYGLAIAVAGKRISYFVGDQAANTPRVNFVAPLAKLVKGKKSLPKLRGSVKGGGKVGDLLDPLV